MTTVEKHIQHFNRLSGNVVTKAKLQSFLDEVKACKSAELKDMEVRLKKMIDRMNGHPVRVHMNPMPYPKQVAKSSIPVKQSKGTAATVVKPKERSQATMKISKKPVDNSGPEARKNPSGSATVKRKKGIYGANDIANRPVQQIELDGKWKEYFHTLYTDTQLMFWGSPGGGKTCMLLQFGEYLAVEKGKNVLFVANEEFKRSTFTKKIKELKIKDHPRLNFSPTIPPSIDEYDAVFLDSVQSCGMDLKQYIKFVNDNYGRIFCPIIQSTKDGDFRGGKDWEHEVDIAGEVRNRRLILRKNRLDPDFYEKSERLWLDEEVSKKQKGEMIRKTVREKLNEKEGSPTQLIGTKTIITI